MNGREVPEAPAPEAPAPGIPPPGIRRGARPGSNPTRATDIELLVAEFQTPLLRYAERLVRNADSAQDVVQEAFARFLNQALDDRTPAQRKAWLFRVVHNLAVDLIRKERRMQQQCEQMPAPPEGPSADAELAAEQTRQTLAGLLATLTENQRAVLTLKFEQGKSYREIAEITGLTIGNVGFLIHRGIKKLGAIARREELI